MDERGRQQSRFRAQEESRPRLGLWLQCLDRAARRAGLTIKISEKGSEMDGGSAMIMGDLKYLRLPITTNIQPGMQVLVITDTAHDPRVWQVIMSTISEIGAEGTLALFDPRPADYFDPPRAVCEAMLKSDVNI